MVILFMAAVIRYHGVFSNTFHADEALFASWSRLIAVWRDPLLQSQVVDKPPLLFYLQAIFYPLLGPVEWAARLPNFIASLLLIPISGILAWRLFGDEMLSVLVAAFITFSPMAIQYSATAFIDPLLTFLLIASLAAGATHNQPIQKRDTNNSDDFVEHSDTSKTSIVIASFLAGILFGLAVMTKYQAWLFLPLTIGLGVFHGWRWEEWRSWLLGFLPLLIFLGIWDLLQDGHFSLIGQQFTSFGGLRLIWSWELWPRLEAWSRIWSFILDSPVLIFALILSVPLLFALLIDKHNRMTAIDLILLVFLVSYFVLHWFVAIPVWDRYLLPVLPLVSLVLGRFVWRSIKFASPLIPARLKGWFSAQRIMWFIPLILLTFQAPFVLAAYEGDLPVGGSPSADEGASLIASELHQAAYGTVLYDHWYSWQWRYHLFDKGIYVSWFPGPEELAEDLAVFGKSQSDRYIVLPDEKTARIILREIDELGFKLVIKKTTSLTDDQQGMTLYQIVAE